jgi:hypothetical protein
MGCLEKEASAAVRCSCEFLGGLRDARSAAPKSPQALTCQRRFVVNEGYEALQSAVLILYSSPRLVLAPRAATRAALSLGFSSCSNASTGSRNPLIRSVCGQTSAHVDSFNAHERCAPSHCAYWISRLDRAERSYLCTSGIDFFKLRVWRRRPTVHFIFLISLSAALVCA